MTCIKKHKLHIIKVERARKTITKRDAKMRQVVNETLRQIAKHHLNIETLEARNSDRLYFREVAVWLIEEVLWVVFYA